MPSIAAMWATRRSTAWENCCDDVIQSYVTSRDTAHHIHNSRHQNRLHESAQILLNCATADESLAHTHSDIDAQKLLRHM